MLIVRREGLRRGLAVAALFGMAVVAVYGVLWLTLGYDPVATIKATGDVYRHGISRIRPYAYVKRPRSSWLGLNFRATAELLISSPPEMGP